MEALRIRAVLWVLPQPQAPWHQLPRPVAMPPRLAVLGTGQDTGCSWERGWGSSKELGLEGSSLQQLHCGGQARETKPAWAPARAVPSALRSHGAVESGAAGHVATSPQRQAVPGYGARGQGLRGTQL